MIDPRVITHATFVDARAGIDPVVREELFDDDRFFGGELFAIGRAVFAVDDVSVITFGPALVFRFVTLRADPAFDEVSYHQSNVDETT